MRAVRLANPKSITISDGALQSAETLRNGDVCQVRTAIPARAVTSNAHAVPWRPQGGASTNIGFHIRVPFKINMPGTYNFRGHFDFGLGGYIGVDGAVFTGGNVYSHVETGATSMTSGEHEFEALVRTTQRFTLVTQPRLTFHALPTGLRDLLRRLRQHGSSSSLRFGSVAMAHHPVRLC